MASTTAHERFDRAAQSPTYQHAMIWEPEVLEPFKQLLVVALLVLAGAGVSFATASGSGTRQAMGYLTVFALLVVAGAFLKWWSKRRTPGAPIERVLAIVVEVKSNEDTSVSQPVTLTLEARDGTRRQYHGLHAVLARNVEPGDIGVAYLTPMSTMGTVMVDFTYVPA